MVNTALFTVGSILGQFVIGLLLALFFHKHFPLSGVIRALFLLPWLIPQIVASASWRSILEQDSGILHVMLQPSGNTLTASFFPVHPSFEGYQFRFRWVGVALPAILISQMIPGIVIANALYTAYEGLGLLNSVPGWSWPTPPPPSPSRS